MLRSLPRRQFLVATAACLGTGATLAAQPVRSDWPARQPVPAFTLTTLDGAPRPLDAERGHAVLLNFWAGWCEPCVVEMPSLASAGTRWAAQGLRIVAANYREPASTVRGFIEARSLAIDVAMDRDGSAAKAFGVHAFPSTVAIDRAGRVRFVVMGECDWTDAQGSRWIESLLGKAR